MMTYKQLQDALENTKVEIHILKQQIKRTTDHREARKLTTKLRELQYLQLWNMDQLQNLWEQGETEG
ncbi:MAG: hypothetical protein ACOY9Y_06625 [Bacillota bacterium]